MLNITLPIKHLHYSSVIFQPETVMNWIMEKLGRLNYYDCNFITHIERFDDRSFD